MCYTIDWNRIAESNGNCLDYCCFVITFEIRKWKFPDLVLLFQDCFDFSESLEFPFEFYDRLANFYEEPVGVLIKECIDSTDQFGVLPS